MKRSKYKWHTDYIFKIFQSISIGQHDFIANNIHEKILSSDWLRKKCSSSVTRVQNV